MNDSQFYNTIICKIKDLGRIETIISEILSHDIFDDLSKHNPYWEHEEEKTCDKLYDIRCGLRCVQDKLEEIYVTCRDGDEC